MQENVMGLENGMVAAAKDSNFGKAESVDAALVNTNQVSL